MKHLTTPALRLLMVLLLALLTFHSTPAGAAQPGEELLTSSGSLLAGQSFVSPIYSTGPANLRLAVTGGTPTDTLTMTVRLGATTLGTWAVRSGETTWGSVELPANSSISVQNSTSTTLGYDLVVYARGIAPNFAIGVSTWSGTTRGDGTSSTLQVEVPTAGRYRFTLGATNGSYQLRVDSNYILKTVVTGSLPNPNDTIYYLPAGVHGLRILQNPSAALTNWSVQVAPLGGTDPLPTLEGSPQVLGGPGGFRQEWIPIQAAAAQPVNLRIQAFGTFTGTLTLELYNGNTRVFISSNVFGGEVFWGTSALTAGANKLHVIVSPGNVAPLAYSITVSPLGTAPFPWQGVSYGNPSHTTDGRSSVRMNFPSSGLYRFTLSGTPPGRYQFQLGTRYITKTVTDTTSTNFTAFVPQGTRPLQIVQDPARTTTRWTVLISPTTSTSDSLPFTRSGGTLGGTGNAFTEEWLPLQASSGRPVNVRLVARGAVTDSLRLELYNANTGVFSATTIYGGETYWGTSALINGTNFLHVVANGGNTGPLDYDVQVRELPAIPTSWAGTSRNVGLNSRIRVNAPVAGTYDITLTVSLGTAQVLIDQPALARQSGPRLQSSTTVLRVDLTAGIHTFLVEQDPAQPVTSWQISTRLRRAATATPTPTR